MNLPKNLAFSFIYDYIYPLNPIIKPMFGCHAYYVGEKIMLIVRKKDTHPEANGVWIATDFPHHESLKKEFKNLSSVYILSEGKAETAWQMIHEDDEHFEEEVIKLCELILKNDLRIGRIPKAKKKKIRKN